MAAVGIELDGLASPRSTTRPKGLAQLFLVLAYLPIPSTDEEKSGALSEDWTQYDKGISSSLSHLTKGYCETDITIRSLKSPNIQIDNRYIKYVEIWHNWYW